MAKRHVLIALGLLSVFTFTETLLAQSCCEVSGGKSMQKTKNTTFEKASTLAKGETISLQKRVSQSMPNAHTTEQFATLSANEAFMALHEEPLPYVHVSDGGVSMEIPVEGGAPAKVYMVKATEESDRFIFVFHEWWGLNDYIKRETEHIAQAMGGKVNVIAIDLFDGKIATTREEAGTLVRSVNRDRARAIIQAVQKYAGTNSKIGTVGWCFGGMWSLQAGLILERQLSACVMYYGTPEKDVEKLKTLNAPVLGIFARQDRGIGPDVVKEFEENMQKAGKSLTVRMYDGDHAFANPSNPKYRKDDAEDAMKATIAFFTQHLK